MSRVGERAEMCQEGCEEAHVGLPQSQPHHHHLAQCLTANPEPAPSQQQTWGWIAVGKVSGS